MVVKKRGKQHAVVAISGASAAALSVQPGMLATPHPCQNRLHRTLAKIACLQLAHDERVVVACGCHCGAAVGQKSIAGWL